MEKIPEHFEADFKTISEYIYRTFCMSIDGDTDKLRRFPTEPLLRTALGSGIVKIYMFDPNLKLTMFIPEMSMKTVIEQLVPFVLRFSLNLRDASLSANQNQKDSVLPKFIQNNTAFSLYIFGGPHLILNFQVDPSGAVAFALLFGNLNTLNYDQYNLDILLELADSTSDG